jgi:eukaryotic-like serine/threonine-protein kinase
MQDKHWQEVESLFHAALEMEKEQRHTYLAGACAGKDSVLAEVQSLLAAFENKNLLDHDAFDMGLAVLQTSIQNSMAGKSIGVYRILTALGKGGMGEVYLADDTRLVRKVALKFLSGELVGDHRAKRQLIKEAQAVAKLDHPNICTVYGIEDDGEHSFIVMQYVEGETLASLVRSRSLEAGGILPLAQQIVSALAEAHAHGIVHRDIKPSNIMVTPSGQAKVLDFGLAKFLWPEREAHGANQDPNSLASSSELIAGTVAYMSPEQLRAEKLDGRSDIFSFGVLLYELIVGKNPFACESDAETISAILTSRPRPMGRLAHGIPPEVTRVTTRCLEKSKELRYQSADELLPDLNRIQRRGTHWYNTYLLRRAAALTLALVLVIGLAWLFLNLRPNKVQALAVMPMMNETSDSEVEYLSDGLTEGLIGKLSRFSGLRVKPLTTVARYRSGQPDAQQIGKNLTVDAVVIGRVVRQGERLSLQARLIRTTDGQDLWSENYDFSLTGLSFLERDISEKVAVALRVRPNDDSGVTHAATRWSPDPEALRNYLYGRSFMQKRDALNIKKAISHLEKAVELDPAYARAHASLAECYISLPSPAYGSLKTEDAMFMARAEAMKALEIDEKSSEAHTALGVFKLKYEWKWMEAEKEFQRAILLDPDYATAHFWYSQLLTVLGRMNEAIAESEKARDLDPTSPINDMNVGRAYYFARQYELAIAHLNRILEKNPTDPRALYVLGYVYQQIGMYDKALELFERIYHADKMVGAGPLGFTYGRMGRTEDALRILKELDELSLEKKNVHPHERALIYMGLNDKDNAFKWLEESYAERFASIPYMMTEPLYDNLRSDPRFADFKRRLEL